MNEIKELKSCREGRFKVSLLEVTRTRKQPEFIRDYAPERVQVQDRVCIQYGKKVNGEWQNQTIWCSPSEFRDLANCIDEFQGVRAGDKSPALERDLSVDTIAVNEKVRGSGDEKSSKPGKREFTPEEDALVKMMTKKSTSKKLKGDNKSPHNIFKIRARCFRCGEYATEITDNHHDSDVGCPRCIELFGSSKGGDRP